MEIMYPIGINVVFGYSEYVNQPRLVKSWDVRHLQYSFVNQLFFCISSVSFLSIIIICLPSLYACCFIQNRKESFYYFETIIAYLCYWCDKLTKLNTNIKEEFNNCVWWNLPIVNHKWLARSEVPLSSVLMIYLLHCWFDSCLPNECQADLCLKFWPRETQFSWIYEEVLLETEALWQTVPFYSFVELSECKKLN